VLTKVKDKYLNINDITESLKVDKSTLKQWIKEGKFPAPMQVSDRLTIWSYAVIENWIAQQQQTQDWVNSESFEL
jgi:predicted DNA-binding transcriptional regulator AlpA